MLRIFHHQPVAPCCSHYVQRCKRCTCNNPRRAQFFADIVHKYREFEDAIIHVHQHLNEFGCLDPGRAVRPFLLHVIRHVQHDVGRLQNGIALHDGFGATRINERQMQQVEGDSVMQNVGRVSPDAVMQRHVNNVIRKKPDAHVHCVLHLVIMRVMQQENQRVHQMIHVFADARRLAF